MDPVTIAALAGVGSTLLGGIFGASGSSSTNAANLQAIRETNAAQKELAEYKYQKDLEQWHRENRYNNPTEQMQRLADAGLNPHLVYNNGNAIMPAGQSPDYETANLQAYHQDISPLNAIGQSVGQAGRDAFDAYMRKELQEAQLAKLAADTAKSQQDTLKSAADTALAAVNEQYRRGELKSQSEYNLRVAEILETQIEQAKGNINYMTAQTEQARAEAHLKEVQAKVQDSIRALNAQQLVNLRAGLGEIAARINAANATADESRRRAALTAIQSQIAAEELNWRKKYGFAADNPYGLIKSALNDPEGAMDTIQAFGQQVGVDIKPLRSILPYVTKYGKYANPMTLFFDAWTNKDAVTPYLRQHHDSTKSRRVHLKY